MGASMCSPDDGQTFTQPAVHECRFPLWAVKVSDFLKMKGPPEPHHVLKEKGLLHQWYPGMFVIFVSHQWLSSVHPDPEGHQVEVLRRALQRTIDGSLQVHEDMASSSEKKSVSREIRRQISEGYLFLDWFAIPQLTARMSGVNEDSTKNDAALAVQSIPAYVELSAVFIALVPELVHTDSGHPVNYASWLSRGWCRAELWCRLLSNREDTSIIVMYTALEAEFMFPMDWQHNSIVEGNFTVEADRAQVVRLGEMAVESKIKHLQANGPLTHYRFYAAMRTKLLREQHKDRDLDEFLRHFGFQSLSEAVQDTGGMNGVLCAVLSGNIEVLRLLARRGADMNHSLQGMGDLGYYDTQTVLMAATKSRQSSSMLEALVELRANVNARSRVGVPALFLCRSPEHVKVLLQVRAELSDLALTGTAAFASPETVQELLTRRCDPRNIAELESGPLHLIAVTARSNGRAAETASLLLAHRADVNARAAPRAHYLWRCRFARMRVAVCGFSNCS